MIKYDGTIWVNGRWQDAGAPAVSVFDHGFLYGDGVFDSMFATESGVFKLDDHLDRFWRSLTAIGLAIPYSRDEVMQAALETIARNRLRDAYLKVLATRGLTAQPLMDTTNNVPTVIVFCRPSVHVSGTPETQRRLTANIVNVRDVGFECLDPRIKSLNYLNHIQAQMEAAAAGADAALMMDRNGHICEGTGYNVFVSRNGVLRTPTEGILEGITRATVIDLARDAGLPVEYGNLAPYDFYTADEVILTSTAGGVMPVVKVDGRTVGSGAPGPIFDSTFKAYLDCIRSGRFATAVPTLTP